MAINNSISKYQGNPFTAYVEPNYTATNVFDQNKNPIELTHNMEDYCVAVDLAVEVKGRLGSCGVGSTENVTYIFHYNNQDPRNGGTSFNGGRVEYGDPDTGPRYLTSTYAEVFINDIKQNNNKYIENIGIESINISYNNWTVPEVEICFVDIRGGALFQPEELRNSNVAGGVQGLANDDVEGSLFKSFFTFPYPIYTLVVKGMYGEPVSYRLSCSECNSEFDSVNGNYKIRAKFVGYRFAFLNDVSFNVICAAPQSKAGGEYWREKVENGDFFVTGLNGEYVEMPTIIDVAKRITQIGDNIEKLKADGIAKDNDDDSLNEAENAVERYKKQFIQGSNNGEGCVSDDGCVYITGNEINLDLFGKTDKPSVVTYDINTDDGGKQYIDIKDDKYKQVGVKFQDNILKDNQLTYQACHVYDISEICRKIKDKKDTKAQNAEKVKAEINRRRNEIIANAIGFKPTVKNITKVLLAHFETLVHMIDNCASGVMESKRTVGEIGINAADSDFRGKCGDEYVPPFPKVTKNAARGTLTTKEDAWMGDIIGIDMEKAKEVSLVNDLLSGVAVIDQEIKELAKSEGYKPGARINGSFCEYPLTYMDPFLKESPFGIDIYSEEMVDGDYQNNWANAICGRFKQLFLCGKKLGTIDNEAIYNSLGRLDAHNIENGGKIHKKVLEVIMGSSDITKKCEDIIGEKSQTYYQIQGYSSKDGENAEYVGDGNDKLLIPNRVFSEARPLKNSLIIDEDYMKYNNMYNALSYKDGEYEIYPEAWRGLFNLNISPGADDSQMISYRSYLGGVMGNTIGKNTQVFGNLNNVDSSGLSASDTIKNAKSLSKQSDDNEKLKAYLGGDLFKQIGDGYRLVNVCGISGDKIFDNHKIVDKYSLFGQKEYYNETDNFVKAYIFASSIGFCSELGDDGILESVSPSEIWEKILQNGFILLPKPWILMIGGMLYLRDNYTNFVDDGIIGKDDLNEWLNGVNLPKNFGKMTVYIDVLKKYFVDWSCSEEKGGFVWFYNRLCFKNKDHIESLSRGWNDIKNNVEGWVDENQPGLKDVYAGISVDTSSENIIMALKPESEVNRVLTNFAYQPIIVSTPVSGDFNKLMTFGGTELFDSSTHNYVSKYRVIGNEDREWKSCINSYIVGLLSEVREIHKYDFDEQPITDDKTYNSEIKIATYNYLKSFYDRWLSGNAGNVSKYEVNQLVGDEWDDSSIFESEKEKAGHFYFIDSYHNKIGDYALLNLNDFNELLIRSTGQSSYSFMQFYQTLLAKNRMMCFVIQNYMDMSNCEKMNRMFTPIPYIKMKAPNDIEDFVVMYSYEYSSKVRSSGSDYTDDGFELTDKIETINQVPKAILDKNGDNGYVIPAFGVSYGGQYQSYFTDIKVGQESGQITEQALQATFMIADMAKKSNSGGRTTNYIGQNLYTVYSNMSFTCRLTMLGCAWVRPLMYFTLLNVPLFRGSYLIQKVSHNITAGNMTTNIEGTRLSKYATPLSDMYLTEASDQEVISERVDDIIRSAGDVDNNCGYKKFAVDGDGGNKLQYKPDEVVFVNDKPMTAGDALADSLSNMVGGGDAMDINLCVAILYNRWADCRGSVEAMYQNGLAEIGGKAIDNNVKKEYSDLIEKVFTNTPSMLCGNETTVDKPVLVYSGGKKTDTMAGNKKIDMDILQSIYDKCNAETYASEGDENKYKNMPFLVQHKNTVYLGGPWQYNRKKWVNDNNAKDVEQRRRVFDAIEKSVRFTDSLKGLSLLYVPDANDADRFAIKDISFDGAFGKVYDMIATTYKEEIGELVWVCVNEGSVNNPNPSEIRVSLKKPNQNQRMEMKIYVEDKKTVYKTIDNVPDNYKYSVAKAYNDEIVSAKEKRNPGLAKFVFPNDEKAIDEYYKFAEKVADCPITYADAVMSVVVDDKSILSGGYSWSGDGSASNRKEPVQVSGFDNFQIGEMTKYVWENKKGGLGGNCAKSVRKAIEKGMVDGTLGGNHPHSGCRYIAWMEKYHFKEVANGLSNTPPPGYEPEDGDIAVIAGKVTSDQKDRHGHIHIYVADKKKWVSDVAYDTIWAYYDIGRPYHIFRYSKNDA